MSHLFAGYLFSKYKPFFSFDYKDYSFKVDLEYGPLYFTRELFTLPGKYFPIALSLKYIQPHTTHNFHLQTGLPKGFKTNYHVFLDFDSSNNKYLYEDADGFLHEFVLAENSTDLYYDQFGTGLMLKVVNGLVTIFDDNDNYQYFDSNNRLHVIQKKVADNYWTELSISYVSNSPNTDSLKIQAITDSFNRTIAFSYGVNQNGSFVQIYYNSHCIATIYKNLNHYLYRIEKDIGDNNIVTDLFSFNSCLSQIELSSDDTFSFSYDNGETTLIESSIEVHNYRFTYQYNRNKVLVYNAGHIETAYDFNQQQLMAQSIIGSASLSYYTLNSQALSCLVKDIDDTDNRIIHFKLNDNDEYSITIPGNVAQYQTPYNQNSNIQSKKMYLFYVNIGSNLSSSESIGIELLDEDSNVLAALTFKKDTSILGAPVSVKDANARKYLIRIKKPQSNSVDIIEAKLIPLIGEFSLFCSNVPTGGPVIFYYNTPYYVLDKSDYFSFNDGSFTHYDFECQMSDYLINERLLRSNNQSSHHFWFNDLTKLVANVSNFSFEYAHSTINTIWNKSLKTIKFNDGTIFINDALFYQIHGKDDCSLSVIKVSHDQASFPQGHQSYNYEEEINQYCFSNSNYLTINDYDIRHIIQKVTQDNGYVIDYSYDAHNNLEETRISSGSHNDIIYQNSTYDSNNRLISQSSLIGSNEVNKTYQYNAVFGYLSKIIQPNNLENIFLNDDSTGERNKTIKYQINSSVFIAQDNDYVDENTSSYSVSNDNYVINYENGEPVEVLYNNQTILQIDNYKTEFQGFVFWHHDYNYANGYQLATKYDCLNRLVTDGYLSYTYDAFNNVIAIYDETTSGLNASTYFTYDYYNQKTLENVFNNNLTMSFTYDDYHRLTNQSSIYDIAYTYFNSHYFENLIKKTTINYSQSILEINNDLDIYSRLIAKSIIFNNKGLKQSYEYYHSTLENNRSNAMIKKATYYDVDNNQLTSQREETYFYDNLGNISSVLINVSQTLDSIDYVYDQYGRIVEEWHKPLNRKYFYAYDVKGNIISRQEYRYALITDPSDLIVWHQYTYDTNYPDRLTSFDNQTITYDNVGNPITYLGKTMTWVRGTLLSSVIDGNDTIDFTYDGFAQRTSKTINNDIQTNYFYINGQLLKEEKTNTSLTINQTIIYLYSHQGLIGFVLNGSIYYYEKNITQDVISIRNANNVIVAKYLYDAYGNQKVLNPDDTENNNPSFIGNINPIRYRSYYYDSDLKMYWLTTRYYDPLTCRFISPDHYSFLDYQKLHGLNLYAYSKNNPVMYYDPSGHSFFAIFAIIVAAIIAVATTIVSAITQKSEIVAMNQKKGDLEYPEDAPQTGDKKYYERIELDGVVYYYHVDDGDEYLGLSKKKLIVHDSWKYTKKEIVAFLNWLKKQDGNEHLNVARVMNEWLWHNNAYNSGIARKSTKDVNVYFNHHDDRPWCAFFFDLWLV